MSFDSMLVTHLVDGVPVIMSLDDENDLMSLDDLIELNPM